ncbi:MAG: hypothetical protein A2070_08850 [Bdellovibrionales bacterium GWC1_52_8]|nr:MAG: hypothetical protein A2070_08850 [Bdellovibrionales bacterium GWC1_52_8]
MSRVCAINTGCNATEAFVDLALNGGAEVINMSLGGLNPFNDGYGVEAALINRITSLKSVLFVISAGNSGPGRQTVGSPSVARLSLSVGASATKGLIQRQYQWPGAGSTKAEDMDADFMLFFSSRGPTAAGGFKPNISAPGTELSSLQLNSAPGARGGLDVYWGTSMSAPAATGAYALLLDAVKKYNTAYPEKALPADAVTLREVMIQSARPFDMNSFDPETGVHSTGQYTWMDQGMGMVDLVAAWKKLQEVRDNQLPISEDDVPVDLEYNVIVSMKNPTGTAYDGSRSGTPAIPELGINQPAPAFGTGLYLDVRGLDTLRSVYIQRKLPDVVATSELAGELTRRLLDTRDEFVLKTMIYGSNKLWIKAGVLNEIDCWDSETANLTIMGRGVDIAPNEDGSATINPFNASRMNVCINREMIANELPPGDHGALIAGYRFVNGKTASLPSFTVPVSLTIPQQTLAHSNALEVNSKVNSFGVARSYVMVPAGTSLVQLTLEVPAVKTTESGLMLRGEKCSGVELMALKGGNTAGVFKTRADARISNCDATGTPSDKNRKLVFSAVDPKPGIWDLHVFGQYAYAESVYKLRVDYINSASDVQIVEGDLSALVGSLGWAATDSTLPAVPDLGQSSFFVDSLVSSSSSQVRKGEFVIVENPQGQLRTYPEGVKKVTVTTGSSPGNDIDLLILQCVPPSVLNPEPQACTQIASSGGAADDESASFMPDPRFVYLVRVDGYSVKDEGKFVSMETLAYDPEFGRLEFNSHGSKVQVSYSLTPAELEKGKLVNSTAYKSGKYKLAGAIVLKMANGTLLNKIPVKVTPQIAELTY